tara:strand:- start:7705 stop:7914 length:210 start_codon:yes stop_codon:yes gene_type:complete
MADVNGVIPLFSLPLGPSEQRFLTLPVLERNDVGRNAFQGTLVRESIQPVVGDLQRNLKVSDDGQTVVV